LLIKINLIGDTMNKAVLIMIILLAVIVVVATVTLSV